MSIEVTRVREDFGTRLEATCVCGQKLQEFVERGGIVSDVPGPLPGDLECECGRAYNSFGQEINSTRSFDPMDAGERWDEE